MHSMTCRGAARVFLAAFLAASVALGSGLAAAQTFPSKTVTIVVPFPPAAPTPWRERSRRD
jgi:tripartite-type tricarboxylate transporter receptor subunit TctC